LWDCGILVFWEYGILRFWDSGIRGSWDSGVQALWDIWISEEEWELMEKIVTVLQVIVLEFVTRWRF